MKPKRLSFFARLRAFANSFVPLVPAFLTHQFLTRLLLSAVVLPLFWGALRLLVGSTGLPGLTNNLLPLFLLTPQGLLLVLFTAALVVGSMAVEILGYIDISARGLQGQPPSGVWQTFVHNLRRLPSLLHPKSFLLVVYLGVLAPLTGMGLSLSFLKQISIPNFVMEFLSAKLHYVAALGAALLLLSALSLGWIFTFHFIAVDRYSPWQAMKASTALLRRRWKTVLGRFASLALVISLFAGAVMGLWMLASYLLLYKLNLEKLGGRVLVSAALLFKDLLAAFFAALLTPLEIHYLTKFFYELTEEEPIYKTAQNRWPALAPRQKPSLLDRLLRRKAAWVAAAMLPLALAWPMAHFLPELLQGVGSQEVQFIAHRGGGVLGPENSLSGIEKAIAQKAPWTEIDIQRTKDGAYIVHHDNTFARLGGVDRTAQELTLAEIAPLRIAFPGTAEPFATLEQVLDKCKGRMGLFIELKGATADTRMVDDVVKLLREKEMTNGAVLVSIEYPIIEYAARQYKDIKTGYIYFLALGNIEKLAGDYLIMEEGQATEKGVDAVHAAGKKAVVWTVNDTDAMERFIDSGVDAIITDQVEEMAQLLQRRRQRTFQDQLFKLFTSASP